MDAGGLLLDESDAQEGSENLHKFLTGYAWLAAHFVNKRMMLFLFRPKHHCVFHQAVQLGAWRINQTMFQTTDDESFLGKLKKIHCLPWENSNYAHVFKILARACYAYRRPSTGRGGS